MCITNRIYKSEKKTYRPERARGVDRANQKEGSEVLERSVHTCQHVVVALGEGGMEGMRVGSEFC